MPGPDNVNFSQANWNDTTARLMTILDSNGQFASINLIQYTEGDTDASITGTAMMWESASNVLVPVSAATPLPVDIQDASISVDLTTDDEITVYQLTASNMQVTANVTNDVAVNVASYGGTATSLGQKDMSASIPTVIASDQSNVPVSQSTASDLKAQVYGEAAVGSAISGNPVPIGLRDIAGQVEYAAGADLGGGITVQYVFPVDGGLQTVNYESDGSTPIVGNVAHDAADTLGPIKIGGKASTSQPGAVANNDRLDAYFDELGYQHIKNEPHRSSIDQVFTNQVFDTGTTAANSTSFDCTRFRHVLVHIDCDTGGAVTDIRFIAQFDRGSGNWFSRLRDEWVDLRFIGAQMPLDETFLLEDVGTTLRIRGEATTTSTHNFTANVWIEGLS